MDITLNELRILASEKGFNIALLEKDYLITKLLYLIKDVEGSYFKGGTALNKVYLDHERLSEDIDFSLTKEKRGVEDEIRLKLKGTMFDMISVDKNVDKFVRLVVHYKLFHEEGTIFIDLNERAKLLLKPQIRNMPHFYKETIPDFEVSCLHENEMIAEKIMATCERYKPRDYFDLYWIIKKKLPVSVSLLKKKFKANGKSFTPALIFKNTNKIYNKWEEDLSQITKTRITFKEVISSLKDYFKYR
jgi:predicted nucleotidyltransferase component of viral defense system